MTLIQSSFSRDANYVPIVNKGLLATKIIAYNGTAGRGAQGATTLFTVTGTVLVTVFGVCTEDLAGANATLEVGISGNTAALIAQTTGTQIDVNEVWNDASPSTVEPFATNVDKIIGAGQDIIETIATADVTDGTITYYCFWTPVSSDGNVVAT